MDIKVFNYIESLDAFLINTEFKEICDQLGLRGWEQTAWIGRYFTLDNDYGEHWFDNWELRDERGAKAKELNIDHEDLLIINPLRLRNGQDGPCHSDAEIKIFWTSVLRSLHIHLEVVFAEARLNHKKMKEADLIEDEDFITNLEDRIKNIKMKYGNK